MVHDTSTELAFDEEWEADALERLETVDYDTELGMQVGRDAQRVAAGELSEAEFYARHHETILDEFGVDERDEVLSFDESQSEPEEADSFENSAQDGRVAPPPGGDGGGGNGQLPGVPGDTNRRSVLKTAGVLGTAAVGLSGVEAMTNGAFGQEDEQEQDVQMGMALDTNRCIACLQCVEACNEENNNTADALWMYVHRYVEDDYVDREEYLQRPCQHCSDPSCEIACPVAARHKRDEDGIVMTDYDLCVGCRYCEIACPYGVNYFQWSEPRPLDDFGDHLDIEEPREVKNDVHGAGNPPHGIMGKCTFCVHRQDSENEDLQGTTACAEICPVDAIQFGNIEDPESDPRQHLDQIDENEETFRLLEAQGTEPNIIYIGNEPAPGATPVEGPRTVEDMHRDLSRDRAGRNVTSFPEVPGAGGEEDGS